MTPSAMLRGVWEENRERILAQVAVIEEAVTDALTGALDDRARAAAVREAHKLAGSVGTLGFLRASEHAREIEHALGADTPPPFSQLAAIADEVVALRCELGHDRGDKTGPTAGDQVPVASQEGPVGLLVVDEDRVRGGRLVAEASGRGLNAVLAETLDAGRRLTVAADPDVVLLDLSWAAGIEATLAFLAETAETHPVVVVTDPEDDVDRVEIARRRGRGFLPHWLAPEETIDSVLGLRERLRAAGTRILAVDDDGAMLGALASTLGEAGLTVESCQDPALFWGRLVDVSPDLVLLDFDMPGVTGTELCRTIRNDTRWQGLPIVFLTSRRDPDSIRAMFDAGADDYIAKPFVGPELVARISNRLERVRLYRMLAETDGLTGLTNRRASVEMLETFMGMSRRTGQPLSLTVLDIDHFKAVNDGHGHVAGDAVLRGVGKALQRWFRGEDVVARWGGDEFVVGTYGLSGADARQRIGDLVEEIRGMAFSGAEGVSVTLSAGLAEYPAGGDSVDTLYQAADRALYEAKDEGRDRVVAAGPDDPVQEMTADVVIVEDDPVLGQLLDHALRTRGHRTHRFMDGLAAVEGLAGHEPVVSAPLILLDWDLPGLDGLRVLRRLAEEGLLERTKVIMLTGRGAEGEVVEALEAGATDHVTKPFSVPVLMERVRVVLGR